MKNLRRWIILCEMMTFQLSDVVVHHIGDSYVAYWHGTKIGYVTVDMYDKSVAPDARHIHKSGIDGQFRRRGVATLLYDTAAAALKQDGLRLVPSPENILSDDALEFWKKRDPALVASDSRHSRGQYGGKTISHKGQDWIIDRIGARFAMLHKADGSGITDIMPKAAVYAALGEPHGLIQKTLAPD